MNLKNLYQNEYSFEETINENMLKIEQFSHLSVKGYLSSSTDENVVAGDKYIVSNDENGVNNDLLFSSKVNQIAYYNNNLGWLFYEPKDGDIAYNQATGEFLTFNSSAWCIFSQGSGGSSSPSVDTSNFLRKSENLLDITDQDTACHNIGTLRDWEIRRLGDYKFSAQPKDHDNWLICDGRELSREEYADLFELIGTTCGAGDGSTTFNIPNFINRTIWGATTVYNDDKETIKSTNLNSQIKAGLPNITGEPHLCDDNNSSVVIKSESPTGCFKNKNTKEKLINSGSGSLTGYSVMFDASGSNPIYGASNTVQPPAIAVNVFILAKV